MECNCIGVASMLPGLNQYDVQVQLCYGIPINCEFECKKEVDGNWQVVSCEGIE